ncbi:DUF1292 domain-containing protein [Tumebacillus permanentifrigoris]|uniref:DUF1292 domain-containing protein n=1 Tax=Tumebacillus permanentifrigoris TaxID=378543 RepID=A0A316DD42_9BACL|nr:DUF1292 domain-containing protein [Tumebacillus permanentifrigoris]PWK13378.1 hypothetical protein C7459_10744 [Tumebacillus permanentifrigoris]
MMRDVMVVRDAQGHEREFGVEALLEMNDQNYVLLVDGEDTLLMLVEGEGEHQELVGIPEGYVLDSLLDAYEIAVEAAPAES